MSIFESEIVLYALKIEIELKKFLEDSRLNIDNNPAERLNRGGAIIRRNCLFARSESGGQRLAILYSFAATCKANNICVFANGWKMFFRVFPLVRQVRLTLCCLRIGSLYPNKFFKNSESQGEDFPSTCILAFTNDALVYPKN